MAKKYLLQKAYQSVSKDTMHSAETVECAHKIDRERHIEVLRAFNRELPDQRVFWRTWEES